MYLSFMQQMTDIHFRSTRLAQRSKICLDAVIMSHRPVFDDDGNAYEVLPGPEVRNALECDDSWAFEMIPEGTNLHKETYEALHVQQNFH